MARIRVRVKSGAKGKPIAKTLAQIKAKAVQNGHKPIYKPKAKLTAHIKDD